MTTRAPASSWEISNVGCRQWIATLDEISDFGLAILISRSHGLQMPRECPQVDLGMLTISFSVMERLADSGQS
jgi:hypothetical protein